MHTLGPRIWLIDDDSVDGSVQGTVRHLANRCSMQRVRLNGEERDVPALVLITAASWPRFRETLRTCKCRWPAIPVLGILPERDASDSQLDYAISEGLDDFVLSPLRELDLVARVRILTGEAPRHPSSPPLTEWKRSHRLEGLVGESPEFVRAIEKLVLFAAAEATTLILGETGSGKELFARAIHYGSVRHPGPFVPVNCAALPDQLFENELFGHAKGAYTDATTSVAGLLAVAERGTLFLDEVDGLSPSAQVKLLRLLQNREYRPLGSGRVVTADVRIVAAMNGSPEALIATGRLREDLYHRLNVLRIVVPPLRRRAGDIPLLAQHFLEQFSRFHKRRQPRLTAAALHALCSHNWPGNIRELEAVLQRAVLLAGQVIDSANLDLTQAAPPPASAGSSLMETKSRIVESFERNYLLQLLGKFNGNVSRAASAAGKDRRTLQRLLQKYEIRASEFRTVATGA